VHGEVLAELAGAWGLDAPALIGHDIGGAAVLRAHLLEGTAARRIAPRPVLVVHGSENRLHLPEESEALYRRAREPKRQLLLEGSGHTEWMFDDHPTFQQLVVSILEFFESALAGIDASITQEPVGVK